ncbi:unnamed protein product [Ranitomeya imitator]|uniref:Zasp-like motif domain-containing protein n=1 Tax=Ranitomeya imitator TaxID=111125 RepID=A0ABN9MD87_9NEOB|nr:unnamed protein product [Ranitomeya imitator]
MQEIKQIGIAHNRSAMPFTAASASNTPKVITAQYNNPAGLYSSDNIQNFNNTLETKSSGAQAPSQVPVSPSAMFKAPSASVFNPLQSRTTPASLQRRHSTSSIPNQVRVVPEELKQAAQICPNSLMEVEIPGLKVAHVQFNSPLQLYSQENILDTLQGQISCINPTYSSTHSCKARFPCAGVYYEEQRMNFNPILQPACSQRILQFSTLATKATLESYFLFLGHGPLPSASRTVTAGRKVKVEHSGCAFTFTLRPAVTECGKQTARDLTDTRIVEQPQPTSVRPIDKDSEVYKMLQENQESNEPPRQSASFLVLQEILETDEKGKCEEF